MNFAYKKEEKKLLLYIYSGFLLKLERVKSSKHVNFVNG